ncbi:Sorting nexin-41 [Paramecium bursaria]
MDDMLESKFLDIQLNELLKSQIENPFIQALQVQRDRISQPIKIEQVLYRQGCYFYQIKSHLGESYRRYSDFEMLRQYILNQYPNFIQKPLPQKETIIQNISKYIIENKELIELRKKKFYIYLNDLQEKIKDDDIFLKFVNIQEEFKDILLKVDPNIVEQMKYVTRVFQYGLSYVQKNPIPEKLQMITNAIKQKMELIITCSQHLDNLQTTIKLKQKQAKILMPQLEHFQEIFNQKAEKIQSLYQRSDALLTIQGILWRLQETLEIYRDLQMKEEYLLAFDSYCLKQIQYTQEEFQKI